MSVSIPQVQNFFLALTRVLAILANVPILGGNVIPAQVRIIVGILLTMALLPVQTLPPDAQALGLYPFFYAIAKELFIGIICGFAALLTFTAIQIAGEMIGFGTGFNSGRVLNPAFGEGSSPLDQFFLIMAVLFFMVVDGHHLFIIAIQKTFILLPIKSPFPVIPLERVLAMLRDLINAGIQLSLPAVGALLMADITLGLLAKVAPQVQVFFFGIPIKIILGLLAVSITFSLYYPVLVDLLNGIGERMLHILGA